MLGYLLSFSIASIVMVSAVVITTGIINNRTAAVAELQAQSIANKVADALVEALAVDQSMPNADYTKALDIPLTIAGRRYYIEITSDAVYVNTSDGLVSKTSPTYGAGRSKTGISGETIYSDGGKINISIERSDVVYQFDFGTGNNTKHSPVEAGYYFVSNTSSALAESLDPPWWNQDYPYRIPIEVTNAMDRDIDEATIKLVLTPTNFDYDLANVTILSPSRVKSNLVFVDAHFSVVASMEVTPTTWYTWWDSRETDDVVDIHIGDLSEGYGTADIDVDTVKLNNQLSWDSFDGSTFSFDAKEAFQSLTSSRLGKKYTPPTPGTYTIALSGLLNDGTPFSGRKVITVADGDLLVSKEFTEHTPGWGITRFDTIQAAIYAANTGDAIYVYEGIYNENIVIDRRIQLIGEDNKTTIIDGGAGNNVVTMTTNADKFKLDSFAIRDGSGTDGHGIFMDYVTGFTISNCNVHSNKGSGIYIKRADDGSSSTIKNCNVYFNGNVTEDDGILLWNVDYLSIINCTSHSNGPAAGEHDADGIALEHSHYNLIKDCQFYNNNDDGINLVTWSSNNTINNCTLYDNYDAGIVVNKKSNYNTITNCEAYDCKYGVAITTEEFYVCSDNVVTNCSIHDNSMAGIILMGIKKSGTPYYVQYNTISHCEIYNNAADGIIFWYYAKHNTVEYCDIHHNAYGAEGNGGIEIYGGSNNTIKYCDVHHNTKASGRGADGIGFVGSVWNTILHCNFYNNDWGVCIFVSGLNNQFKWCQFYDNTNDGAYLEYGSNTNSFQNCDFYFNGEDGATITIEASFNWFNYCNFFDNGDDGVDMIGFEGITPKPVVENLVGHSNIFGNRFGVYISGGPATKLNAFYYNNIEFNSKNEPEPGAYQGWADMITLLSTFQFDNGHHPATYMWDGGTPYSIGNWWGDFSDGYREQVWIDFVRYDDVYLVEERGSTPMMIDRKPVNYDGDGANPFQTGERITGEWQRMFIQVDDNNPDPDWYDYYHVETITEALDHVTNRGTIYIYNGIYNEKFTIAKTGVTIFGESRDGVIIDGTGLSNHLINIDRSEVNISSLTIYNGKTSGIYIYNDGTINIRDCTIYTERSDDPQPCINIGGSNAENIVITNCTIYSNGNTDYGVKIYNGAHDIQIIDCEIYGHAQRGVYITDGISNRITNCVIHDNTDEGIYLDDADSTIITGCIVENNEDGIYMKSSENSMVKENCYIHDNTRDGVRIFSCGHVPHFPPYISLNNSRVSSNGRHGVYIDTDEEELIHTCTIEGNGGDGIYIYDSSEGCEIQDCTIYQNTNGIKIDSSVENRIINCEIYENDDSGIYLTTDSIDNIIEDCSIYSHTDTGDKGIYISDRSDSNTIESNTISKNDIGIFLDLDSDQNDVIDCEIVDNVYCINVNTSNCGSNTIYGNIFRNGSAWDEGTNQWDNGSEGGNHWDDYDEGWEGAYDFYTGFDQDILGSDGKVDTPRNISGATPENKDRWPLGGGRYNVRPYYIDYWNPYGESIILVKMNLKSQREHHLYLYYGYDQPLTDIHNHTMDEVSVFFDDFENPPGPSIPYNIATNWDLSPTSGDINDNITDGCLNLTTKEFIMTKDFSIPSIADPSEGQPPSITANESSYTVEALMKVNEGQGNMMGFGIYESGMLSLTKSYYILALNETPNTNLSMYKYYYYDPGTFPPGVTENIYHLKETTTLAISDWLRMKTFLYTGKFWYKPDTGDPHKDHIARIRSYLYHHSNFADIGNISGIDTHWYETGDDGEPIENAVGVPYMEGKVGLGCSLMSPEEGHLLVDWIRVLKNPAISPAITIGSPESAQYGWEETEKIQAKNILTFNPFTPGPVLRDCNYGIERAVFRINLSADDYVITITRGNYSGTCNATTISYPGGTLQFPETEKGKYETKWFPVHHNGGDLDIAFEGEPGKTWIINALTVERGGKGIRVGLD